MGQYDAIVIGAGVAGLAAAHALRDSSVLLLEREPRSGGRVLTVGEAQSRIDLGACFAFNVDLLPASAPAPTGRSNERGPLGLHYEGGLFFADAPKALLEQLPWTASDRRALDNLRAGALSLTDAQTKLGLVLRSLFHQIHPGEIAEYCTERQAGALYAFHPDHWAEGNGALVAAYERALSAQVELECSVVRIEEQSGQVLVEYERAGIRSLAAARSVIVATDAKVARSLVVPANPACAEFLSAVRYARYTVVAFRLEATALAPDFRFVITPQAKLSLVMQQSPADRSWRGLLAYYADRACEFADLLDDVALVEHTRRELMQLGLVGLDVANAPAQVQRWPISGTVLTPEYQALKRASFARASRRVFLAGDYLAMPPGWGYGLDDAVASGRSTGAHVLRALGSEL